MAKKKQAKMLAQSFIFTVADGTQYVMHRLDAGEYECLKHPVPNQTSKVWKEKDILFMLETKRWVDYEAIA